MYGSSFRRLINGMLSLPMGFYGEVTRRNGPWVVISVGGTGFYDNTKYMFSHLYKKGGEVYLITPERSNVLHTLNDVTGRVVYYPSKRAFRLLSSAKVVFVDRTDWMFDLRGSLLRGAFKVNLWHGIGLKRLERCAYRKQGLKGKIKYLVGLMEGRWIPYDLFISTSDFYTRSWFFPCFFARRFEPLGYPRNDILFEENDIPEELAYIGADVKTLDMIKEFREKGYQIYTYAPTYRYDFSNAFNRKVLNLNEINSYMHKIGGLFVIKMHPWEARNTDSLKSVNRYDHIVVYDGVSDIQPLLRYTDVLITDYSSVYMDFLLLDRRVIFFPFDRDVYDVSSFTLPYDVFTPGPKVYNQKDLLETMISSDDAWMDKRRWLRDIAFKFIDGYSAERIYRRVKLIVDKGS